MPQTREAISHAQAAGLPMIFAINKMDKEGAQPEKIKEEVMPEDSRLKRAGVTGYNKPKATPKHPTKSHVVVAKVGSEVKLIRFGQQGVSGSPDGSARNKAFKDRHASNIAKGKMSAAYWADKVKW
jgi:hypothetical protein